MSKIFEDFFDDESVNSNIMNTDDIETEKSTFWIILKIDASKLSSSDCYKVQISPTQWAAFNKAIVPALIHYDIIDSKDDFDKVGISIIDRNTDKFQNAVVLSNLNFFKECLRNNKKFIICLQLKGNVVYKVKHNKFGKNIDSFYLWFSKWLNNFGCTKLKYSFAVSLSDGDMDSSTDITISTLSEKTFQNIKFVESLINSPIPFTGTEFKATKRLNKRSLDKLSCYTLQLYRLCKNKCITGDSEHYKRYNIDEFLAGLSFCEPEWLIYNNEELTKKMVNDILSELNNNYHYIRPFYLSDDGYNAMIIIYATDIVVTIDDERYLVHLHVFYGRPDANSTMPQKLTKDDIEMTEKFIDETSLITGNKTDEIITLLKNLHMLPHNWNYN